MLRNVGLAVAATLVFFGLLEIALRLSGRVPTQALRSPDLVTLDSIPGLFEPGQEFVDRIIADLPYQVTINALGTRGGAIEQPKRTGSIRVLCLGDSYTFGAQVDDDEAFPAVLDRLLQAVPAPGASAINAGASGFTITDELAYLQTKGLRFEPDVVVLVFTQNDLQDLRRPRPMIEVMRDHARLKSRFLLGPSLKLLQRTAIFNGMQRAAAWMKVEARRSDAQVDAAAQAALWGTYRQELARVAALLKGERVRLLLVAWPSSDHVVGASASTYGELEDMASELGIEYLDLARVMRDVIASGSKAFLVPLDGHPSPEGHAAAAGAIAGELLARHWVSPAPGAPHGAARR